MQFGKDRRVRKRSEYRHVQATGCRVSTQHFVFVASANSPEPSGRLGITASRKVGNAVKRNRLKRLVREAYRAYPEIVPEGVDLVVICRRDGANLRCSEVVLEWKTASGRLKRALRAPRANRPKKPAGPKGQVS
jgi:ribonuclease P protein component